MIHATHGRPVLEGLDLMSRQYSNHPEIAIARAHKEQPVYFYPPMNLWVVTKYDDIRDAFMDSATYSSRAWGLVPPPADLAPLVKDFFTDDRINSMDPPEHTKVRIPVQRALLAAGNASTQDMIRRLANEIIDEFIDRGECDLMQEFAYKLPLYVVLELLGLPKDRAEDYHKWGVSFFALFTPKAPEGTKAEHLRPMPEEVLRKCWGDLAEANEYLRGVVEELDRNPGENMLSQLLQLRELDGSRTFTIGENVRSALDYVSAGHDTTTTLIGHLIYYTHRDAAIKQRLHDNPELIPLAVEETVRRRGSADSMFRITTRDVEIRGVSIPKGAIIMFQITAGDLDPDVFPNSEVFDIDRPNLKRFLAFGGGRHVCAGQGLARVQGRIAYEELTRRIPFLRIKTGFEMTYEPTVMNVIIDSLPVEWDLV